MLVVKCKEDVVANVPDIRAARIASVRTFALPKAVEDPFKNLANRQLLKEIIPVFFSYDTRTISVYRSDFGSRFVRDECKGFRK